MRHGRRGWEGHDAHDSLLQVGKMRRRGEWCAQAELPGGSVPVLPPLLCTSQEAFPEGV